MSAKRITRREMLRGLGLAAAGTALAACAPEPEVIREEVTVKETVVVEVAGTPKVVEVEKVVTATPPPEKVFIRIEEGTFWAPMMQEVVDEYMSEHPDVTIEIVELTGLDHEEVFSKILSMFAAGDQLDTAHVCTEGTYLFAGQGLAEPLNDYAMRDKEELFEYFNDVHPVHMEAMLYEGDLYGFPWSWNGANMYYNTKMFAEVGIGHPDPEWTKDDFYEIAKEITKVDASGEAITYGYGWINRLWGSWMPWIFANGGNLLTEERAPGGEWFWETFYKDDPAAEGRGGGWRWDAPKANDPANVEALEFMVQLFNEGISPAVELGGGATLQGFFTTGKLAMTPAGGFWALGMHNAGMAPDEFDCQFFPKWKVQRHQFGTCAETMIKYSKFKDEVWEWMKYVNRVESQDRLFKEGIWTTPVRRSLVTAERFAKTGPEHWHVFYDTLDKYPNSAPIPAPPESNPMTTIFTKYTGIAMALEMTPQEALDGMQKDLEELFSRRGE